MFDAVKAVANKERIRSYEYCVHRGLSPVGVYFLGMACVFFDEIKFLLPRKITIHLVLRVDEIRKSVNEE